MSESAVGFYGKLPSRGDFVRRGLSNAFVDGWDAWLQSVLAESRAQLGDRWLDAYLTAPIWRFAIGSGVIDESVWCGAVMPSVDRVNRYFPLTVAARCPPATDPVGLIRGNLGWYRDVEALLMDALDDDSKDLEVFYADLLARPPVTGDTQPVAGDTVELSPAGVCFVSHQDEARLVDAAFSHTLTQLLADYLGAVSVFWRFGSPGQPGELRIVPQLPSASSCNGWFFAGAAPRSVP